MYRRETFARRLNGQPTRRAPCHSCRADCWCEAIDRTGSGVRTYVWHPPGRDRVIGVTPIAPQNDPLLERFIAAQRLDRDQLLRELPEAEAAPVIARVLRAKSGGREEELAELTSAAREELISRLLELRSGDSGEEIRNFWAYVATIA